MKPIYLIGFMGSGKTSTAKEVASRLKLKFVDTDKEIETATGTLIPVLFSTQGEEYFREKETEILCSLPHDDLVVATGGGIIGKETNRKWMQENGYVVFLDTSWNQVVKRLGEDPSRPLWNKGKQDLYYARKPIYKETAHLTISTNDKSPRQVAEEVISGLDWWKSKTEQ